MRGYAFSRKDLYRRKTPLSMREGSWGDTVGIRMAALRCKRAESGRAAKGAALCLGQGLALKARMKIQLTSRRISKISAATIFFIDVYVNPYNLMQAFDLTARPY